MRDAAHHLGTIAVLASCSFGPTWADEPESFELSFSAKGPMGAPGQRPLLRDGQELLLRSRFPALTATSHTIEHPTPGRRPDFRFSASVDPADDGLVELVVVVQVKRAPGPWKVLTETSVACEPGEPGMLAVGAEGGGEYGLSWNALVVADE